MKIYSHFGIKDFILCLGYKGYMIKEYFFNYTLHMSDVTFDMRGGGNCHVHSNSCEPWTVTLVDTGEKTFTGGRIKRIAPYLGEDDTFLLTYGDGVGDIDIAASIDFHRAHGCQATLTAVRPPARFGTLKVAADNAIEDFAEKPVGDNSFINGGFFVLSRSVIDYIEGDETIWERTPLETLVRLGELKAFHHHGFWQPMDTLKDKEFLDGLWENGNAPWKVWA